MNRRKLCVSHFVLSAAAILILGLSVSSLCYGDVYTFYYGPHFTTTSGSLLPNYHYERDLINVSGGGRVVGLDWSASARLYDYLNLGFGGGTVTAGAYQGVYTLQSPNHVNPWAQKGLPITLSLNYPRNNQPSYLSVKPSTNFSTSGGFGLDAGLSVEGFKVSGSGALDLWNLSLSSSKTYTGYGMTVKAQVPQINISASGANVMIGSGSSDVLSVSGSVGDLVSSATGIPLKGSWGSSNILSVDYTLLDAGPTLHFGVQQKLTLELQRFVQLHAVYTLKNPTDPPPKVDVTYMFNPLDPGQHESQTLILPFTTAVKEVTVTPTYFIRAILTDDTNMYASMNLYATVGEGSVCAFDDCGGFGPLLHWESQQIELGSLDVYDGSYEIGGWNRVVGSSFIVKQVTPEPITLLLLGSGVLVLGRAVRRRS